MLEEMLLALGCFMDSDDASDKICVCYLDQMATKVIRDFCRGKKHNRRNERFNVTPQTYSIHRDHLKEVIQL